MPKQNQARICKTPDLCMIACPYNRILTDLGEVVCEPVELLPDEAATIEVVFDDSQAAEPTPN